MKFSGIFLLWMSAAPALAQETTTKLVMSLDLLNRQISSTKTSFAGTSTKISSTEVKSAKPGGLQVALFSRGWGLLANIAPDTATSGLVGAAYETIAGQYLGIAYNLNSVNYSDATPSARQEFYGMLGYHIVLLGQEQRVTALWTLGPTYTELTKSWRMAARLRREARVRSLL